MMRISKGRVEAPPLRVLVIGAGVSGILMGVRLLSTGTCDVTILEKAERLGGTWRDNVYPGVACDVAAHLYVYSFEPAAHWTHRYAKGPDLWSYYNAVAEKYGVSPRIRYGQEVVSAEWQGAYWKVVTGSGDEYETDVLISAVGRLHHPVTPDIEGLDSFDGPAFHSARWDTTLPLEGKRVGLIGTGSTATQITAALVSQVQQLTLFQRTPQWVMPIQNVSVARWRRALLRVSKRYRRSYRTLLESQTEARGRVTTGSEEARLARDKLCTDALAAVRDPALRAKLTPDYAVGCKRLVISGTFYDAVQQPNVEVVTERINRIEPRGVVTDDGVLHPVDVLVLATGFDAGAYMRPMTMSGENGVKLEEIWSDIALNYRSVAIPHMPNFFMINGPYSPGGSSSVVSIVETQVDYIVQLLDTIARDRVRISPSEARSRELLSQTRDRAKNSVWGTGGCRSWYLDRHGVPTIDPVSLTELRAQLSRPVLADFEVQKL